MHIGMLTDYVAVDFANGPALATQTFKRNMEMRGHKVTLIGPRPGRDQRQAPPGSILFDSVAFRQYDKVRFGFPKPMSTFLDRPAFEVVHAHTNALTMHWPALIRKLHGIPVVQTNTVYLPGFAHHAIPEEVLNYGPTKPFFDGLTRGVENVFGGAFNEGDGLIVQCQGLVDYWRNRGLQIPIHIIQRPIDVRNFNRELGPDPFQRDFARGSRLFVACRHAGEKSLDQLLAIFAHRILPHRPDASLTLIGDGPAHQSLRRLAETLGIAHRTHFVGERPQRDLPEWYAYADLFVYTSMTETFGQVVSEALWMGTPVVGFDDGMGVSHQVKHGNNGLLVAKGKDENAEFAAAVLQLLDDPAQRAAFGLEAARRQRLTSGPEVVYKAYEDAYVSAKEHLAKNPPPAMSWRNLKDRMELSRRHLLPWVGLHGALVTLGSVPTSYRARSEVPFDAAPLNPADESYAHRGERTPLPAKTEDVASVAVAAESNAAPQRQRRASSARRESRRKTTER